MAIRGSITIECDRPKCHAEIVIEAEDVDVSMGLRGLSLRLLAADWWLDEHDEFLCPECANPPDIDEAYERAAARARNNDFAETGGKDWT